MSWHGGNRFLTREEMQDNATYIWFYLHDLGWTINAVSGMLGNMQTESTINPNIWENLQPNIFNRGYGLVQWTPSTKYIDWCEYSNISYEEMDSNLMRIIYEVDNNIQWGRNEELGNPPYSFYEFTQSEEPPYTLGMNFLYYYERPSDQNQPNRGSQANEWYEFLTGVVPPEPEPKIKKLPLYYYLRRF